MAQDGLLLGSDLPAQNAASPADARLAAVLEAARFHATDLDRDALRAPANAPIPAPLLVEWIRGGGLWARAVRLRWRNLIKVDSSAPIVLLLNDGGAVLLTQVDPNRNIVWIKDPAFRHRPAGGAGRRTAPVAGLGRRGRC